MFDYGRSLSLSSSWELLRYYFKFPSVNRRFYFVGLLFFDVCETLWHCDAICKFLECVWCVSFRCPGFCKVSFCIVDVGIFALITYFVIHFVCVCVWNISVMLPVLDMSLILRNHLQIVIYVIKVVIDWRSYMHCNVWTWTFPNTLFFIS